MNKNPPCKDERLQKLCSEYLDMAPCCDAAIPRGDPESRNLFGSSSGSRRTSEEVDFIRDRLRERGKILWGRADCNDLFELKKEMLGANYFKFKATSWCMFPSLKKGDTLKVEYVRAKDIKIGDVPAYRSNSKLYAHRIVDKKTVGGKNYIITRPDRAGGLGDPKRGERIPEEDILGRITEVKRGRRAYSTEKRKATPWDRFLYKKDRALTKIAKTIQRILGNSLGKVQSFKPYQFLIKKAVNIFKAAINFDIVIPSRTKLEIYEYRPLQEIDISGLKEYRSFHIRMRLRNMPIGCASFLNRTGNCPHKGLWMGDIYVRLRYRNMGFEKILADKAKAFISYKHES